MCGPSASNAVDSAKTTKQKSIELIAFDRINGIQYQGFCKLQINTVSKFLFVEPVNEAFRDITATFDWKFIRQKNIIFVFAKHESQDFVLIFNNEEKCQNVFNGIFKRRDKDFVDKEIFQERFLIPIFKKIQQDGLPRLNAIFSKWIHKHDETKKKEYLQLLNKHQNESNIQERNDAKHVKQEIDHKPQIKINWKRKHHQVKSTAAKSATFENLSIPPNSVDKPVKVSSIIDLDVVILDRFGEEQKKKKEQEIVKNKIVRSPNFEFRRNIKGVSERKLIIFSDVDRKLCYIYRYHTTSNGFICRKCNVSAKVIVENGDKYIVFSENKHYCEPTEYEPEMKTIDASKFMIFNQDDDTKLTKLVIFTSSTKEFCYEYTFYQSINSFNCCGCIKTKKKGITARLLNNSNGQQCVEISKTEHICTPKKFILEEFQPKIIHESDFKLYCNQNGKPYSKLIIFDSEKDGFVYEYYLRRKVFACNGCKAKKKNTVTAKLREKENGEKYFELSAEEHICKSKKYDLKKFSEKKTI